MAPKDKKQFALADANEAAQIDNLAAFVDLVLGDQPGRPPDYVREVTVKTLDPSERPLGETILTLRQQLGFRQPDAALAQRIRTRLITEWLTLPKPSKPKSRLETLLSTIRPVTRPRQTRARLALAFTAVLILFLFTLPFVASLDVSLPGAAGGVPGAAGSNALPLFLLALALTGAAVWWLSRQEK